MNEGAFIGATGLTTIRLDRNKLTSLPKGTFTDLRSLRTLHLEYNLFSSLDEDVFAPLSNLRTLILTGNMLERIPEKLIGENSKLRVFEASNNKIASIEEGAFKYNRFLEVANLEGNRLQTLNASAFLGTGENLRVLNIQRNMITSIPQTIFSSLIELVELHMGFNQFNSLLPDGIFDNLKNLSSRFEPKACVAGSSFGCTLQTLGCVVSLSDGHVKMDCSNRGISGVVDLIDVPDYVNELDFGDNSLVSILPTTWRLCNQSLMIMRAPRNAISVLPPLDSLNSLKVLEFANNLISSLTLHGTNDSVFIPDVSNLTHIDLSLNPLGFVSNTTFSKLNKLQDLQLIGTQLNAIQEGTFSEQIHLERLDVGRNNIRHISNTTLMHLINLKSFSCAFNKLMSLDDVLPPNLVHLSLEGNYLTTLEEKVLAKLSFLESLNVHRNRIMSLPAKIFVNLPGIKKLKIGYDGISLLKPDSSFAELPISPDFEPTISYYWNGEWEEQEYFHGYF